MMKKILSKKYIQIIILFLASYATFFIYNNYKLITNKRDIGVHNVSLDFVKYNGFKKDGKKLVAVDNRPYIIIDSYNMYYDKISFNYETDKNFNWDISALKTDYRNKFIKTTISGGSEAQLNFFEERLNFNSRYIKIVFNTNNLAITNIKINNEFEFISYNIIFFIMIFFIPYAYVVKRKYFHEHIEVFFMVLSLSAGLTIIFSTPISLGQSFDDQIHYNTAYELMFNSKTESETNISNVPYNNFAQINTLKENKKYMSLLNENSSKIAKKNAKINYSYNKIAYIPMSLGIALGKLCNNNEILAFYLGKIFNLVTYTMLMFFSIKISPKFKYLITLIGLLPTSIFLASNYSYDAFITGFITLGLAAFLHEYYSIEKINLKYTVISIISFVVGVSSKAVYIPLLLTLLLIDESKFNNKKYKNIFRISIIMIVFFVMATFVLPATTGQVPADVRGGNTDVTLQLLNIVRHPISFTIMFSNIISKNVLNLFLGNATFNQFAYLGDITKSVYFVILACMVVSMLIENKQVNENRKLHNIFIFILLMATVYLIFLALYLSFTPVGLEAVNGVQGRYFIPLILPLFMIPFINLNIDTKKNETNLKNLFVIMVLFILFVSLYENVLCTLI